MLNSRRRKRDSSRQLTNPFNRDARSTDQPLSLSMPVLTFLPSGKIWAPWSYRNRRASSQAGETSSLTVLNDKNTLLRDCPVSVQVLLNGTTGGAFWRISIQTTDDEIHIIWYLFFPLMACHCKLDSTFCLAIH